MQSAVFGAIKNRVSCKEDKKKEIPIETIMRPAFYFYECFGNCRATWDA